MQVTHQPQSLLPQYRDVSVDWSQRGFPFKHHHPSCLCRNIYLGGDFVGHWCRPSQPAQKCRASWSSIDLVASRRSCSYPQILHARRVVWPSRTLMQALKMDMLSHTPVAPALLKSSERTRPVLSTCLAVSTSIAILSCEVKEQLLSFLTQHETKTCLMPQVWLTATLQSFFLVSTPLSTVRPSESPLICRASHIHTRIHDRPPGPELVDNGVAISCKWMHKACIQYRNRITRSEEHGQQARMWARTLSTKGQLPSASISRAHQQRSQTVLRSILLQSVNRHHIHYFDRTIMKSLFTLGAALLGFSSSFADAAAVHVERMEMVRSLEGRQTGTPQQCPSAGGNGPTSRQCWAPGLTSFTDTYTSWPNTGVTVSYNLRIENTTCSPDGASSRVCMLINGRYPGPTIVANWGDTIRVTVRNLLQHNGTSIHWHGFRMLNTNIQDGMPRSPRTASETDTN
jgi:hypothetical protein